VEKRGDLMEQHSRVDVDPKKILKAAKHLLDMGCADQALQATTQVLLNDADHLGALEIHVRAQWRIGDFVGALRSLRRLTLLNPYEPGYYLMQGDVLNLMGQPLQARRAFERCLTFDGSSAKSDALSQIALIDAQHRMGKPEDGLWDSGEGFDIVYAAENSSSVFGLSAARPS